MVLNFPLLPHSLPLSASQQCSEKLAENIANTFKSYSISWLRLIYEEVSKCVPIYPTKQRNYSLREWEWGRGVERMKAEWKACARWTDADALQSTQIMGVCRSRSIWLAHLEIFQFLNLFYFPTYNRKLQNLISMLHLCSMVKHVYISKAPQ